jgi:glucose-6-phosphate 1-dehydrogenase
MDAETPALRVRDPLTITIFGASGDLTQRKLMPALYRMYVQGFLPESFAIVGVARRDYDDDAFRTLMGEAIRAFGRAPSDGTVDAFCGRLHYHRGDIEDADTYPRLQRRLADATRYPPNHLFYLSIKPELFEAALTRMKGAGLIRSHYHERWTRVVIEKPFGHDLASAVALNQSVRRHLHESQVYRIDHFLGKETVQNILSFRFANAIFEPLFNNHLVDHIQITAAETVGMESGRGAYYDASGAIRDMVQNHMFQLLCLVTMDPPASLQADAIRNEKLKVLQSIIPPAVDHVRYRVIRGQYTSGRINGEPVKGYREEERVSPASRTESFVALRLFVENWRWAGVPVYLRTGKRMAKRATEIVVHFRTPPLQLFQTVECVGDVCDLTQCKPNQIIFRIQPDEGIALHFSAKRPVLQVQVENVAMDFSYSQTWQKALPEAYERLLLDVMRGDSTLFTRSDEVEAAWQIVDPILQAWRSDPDIPVHEYAPGSWGPEAANDLLRGQCDSWRNP